MMSQDDKIIQYVKSKCNSCKTREEDIGKQVYQFLKCHMHSAFLFIALGLELVFRFSIV
jgi:hypothetical protein